jgi:hypothetical protein
MATADASGYQDRSDRMAQGKASRLTAPSAGDPKAAKKAADEARKAADERTRGYLEQVEGERRILEEQDKFTQEFYAKQERRREEEAQAEERARRGREQGQQFAAGLAAGNDPIARLQLELETKSALLAQYAAQDQENLALYAAAKVQLEQDTAARITEILAEENSRRAALQSQTVQAYGSLFGSLADLSKQFAGEQSGIYKAMFVAQKAFAIAQAILGIQAGAAKAYELGWPAGAVAAASVLSQGANLISTIRGTNYGGGRMYGGPVSAGSLYRVNETGAPEMFVGSGGRQYMLPTQGGQVIPADGVGGASVEVNVHNYSGEQVQVRQGVSPREIEIIVGRAAAEVGRQFSSNEGPAFAGLVAGTNARSKL